MKSLAELNAIKDKMKNKISVRGENDDSIKIIVGMATCGIAAGARPVLTAFSEEVAAKDLANVVVSQTGCIGICQYEPVVEVFEPGKEKVTYIRMNAEKAKQILESHIIGGKVLTEYTIGSIGSSEK
jgi:NADP-reducing hydrogenase subunit HndB